MFLRLGKNKKFIELFLGFVIIGAASIAAFLLFKTKPMAKKQVQKERPPLVQTTNIRIKDVSTKIRGQGKLEAAKSLDVKAEVRGRVIYKNEYLVNGGFVKKNDVLLKIDPVSYELILAQKEAALAKAKLQFDIESAKRAVAKKEYKRRDAHNKLNDAAKNLALRIPYFEKAKAELKAAQADVKRAKLDLKKTIVKSPIDALVLKAQIDEGELLFMQAPIATLIGTNKFYATINIPLSDLEFIQIGNERGNKKGSKVLLTQIAHNNSNTSAHGYISGILPALGSLGHMARLMITINEPLTDESGNINHHALLPESSVTAYIEGKTIKNALVIPREAVTEENFVYRLNEDMTLEKTPLTILKREKDVMYARGDLSPHDEISISNDPDIKNGTPIRIAHAKDDHHE